MSNFIEQNRQQTLIFDGGDYTGGRVVMVPQGWCDFFQNDNEEDGVCLYAWIGSEQAKAWQTRASNEYLTTDAQGWVPVVELAKMRQIDETEARRLDPTLFDLLDAIDKGEAK